MALELYEVWLVVLGVVLLGVAALPRIAAERPVSMPIFYVGFGLLLFGGPFGLPAPDPLEQGTTAERLAETGVIVALMAAGLKIDRVPGLRRWASTWRLLVVTMPLSIAGAALVGWGLLGLLVPTALLLGAVVAPTDPVLASETQVEEPGESPEAEPHPAAGGRDEVRFALTSEAGLNDGLAFPFTNLAIALALVGLAPANWLGEWLLVAVGYKILAGTVLGIGLGWLLAKVIFSSPPRIWAEQSVQGIEALAGTFLVYGLTELLGGYGFIAVFVASATIRHHERSHDYQRSLHSIAELSEQLFMAFIMVLFGGAIAGGLLAPLTAPAVVAALLIVFGVRPLAGLLGLLGFDRNWLDRSVIAFFGIRGIGSFYYLSHGLNQAPFPDADFLWALVGLIVLTSIVVHGITATPVMRWVHGAPSSDGIDDG